MGWFSFLTPIINHLSSMGTLYLEKKKVVAEGKLKIEAAKAEAEAKIILTRLESEIEWEKNMADGSRSSWKDEWWTIVLSVPMILAFIPTMVPYLEDGFNVLALMPEWYGVAVGLAISAAFGKNIVQYFTNLRK